ncbi:hypothetical protein MMC10_000209 [Thelotrema lepadinum]|nr:hypothetical protein [Thelotrema lepadinum]
MKHSVLLRAVLGFISLAAAAPLNDLVVRTGDDPEIVGGTTVGSATTYPFIANLQESGSFICGGTILSTTKILTAAHCAVVASASQFRFRVGTLTYNSGGTLVSVASKAVHPKYNANTVDYDVAVMTLATPLTFSSTIAAAKLVASGTEPTAGESTTVIGWGTTSEGGSVSSTLRQVSVPVVSLATCKSDYSGDGTVTARMFCAAASGKDSCNGDSGGPILNTASKTLLGGVSWGEGCAEAGFPGVYSDYANSELNSWIKAQL